MSRKPFGRARLLGVLITAYDRYRVRYEHRLCAALPELFGFIRNPFALPIVFEVNIANSGSVPANAVTLIQDAIIAAFSGSDGGARAKIGTTLFASRYYAPVVALGSWVQLISIKVGSINDAAASFTASVATNHNDRYRCV